jgi:hypothetical protein
MGNDWIINIVYVLALPNAFKVNLSNGFTHHRCDWQITALKGPSHLSHCQQARGRRNRRRRQGSSRSKAPPRTI